MEQVKVSKSTRQCLLNIGCGLCINAPKSYSGPKWPGGFIPLDLAAKWLRERKKIWVTAILYWNNFYCYQIKIISNNSFVTSTSAAEFDSYEKALDSGIKVACKDLLQKQIKR